MQRHRADVLDAWLDLVHGSACVGCPARDGRCARDCARCCPPGRPVRPTPCPDGLAAASQRGVRRAAARHGPGAQGAGGFALAAPARAAAAPRRRPCARAGRRRRPRAGALASRRSCAPGARPDAADRPGRCAVPAPGGEVASRCVDCLEQHAARADQAGLTAGQRAANLPVRWACAPAARAGTGTHRLAGVDAGVRRRADDRCHSPRGPARAGGAAGLGCAPW